MIQSISIHIVHNPYPSKVRKPALKTKFHDATVSVSEASAGESLLPGASGLSPSVEESLLWVDAKSSLPTETKSTLLAEDVTLLADDESMLLTDDESSLLIDS